MKYFILVSFLFCSLNLFALAEDVKCRGGNFSSMQISVSWPNQSQLLLQFKKASTLNLQPGECSYANKIMTSTEPNVLCHDGLREFTLSLSTQQDQMVLTQTHSQMIPYFSALQDPNQFFSIKAYNTGRCFQVLGL